jgi:glycerol-3-phosphate dehydrogenase
VIGGKLTTYRNLAEEVTSRIARHLRRKLPACETSTILLPGAEGLDAARAALEQSPLLSAATRGHLLDVYGGRAVQLLELVQADADLAAEICPYTHAIAAEVLFAFREELATTVADVLLRRCMAGLGPDLGRAALPRALSAGRRHLHWSQARADAEERRYLREIDGLRRLVSSAESS